MVLPIIVLAGASGDLGSKIARALVARGAQVRALVRPDMPAVARAGLQASGLHLAEADPYDRDAVAATCEGAGCVVSALNGVRDVMIHRQTVLLEGAVKAGVGRFIPSDYSSDFTRTRPGDNRNFDLRREFMAVADRAPIKVTSILNGAFMDMLGREMPVVQARIHRVLYWSDADQPLDFTTKENVAAYVAATAMDETTPRFLRIAGDVVTARDIARILTDVSRQRYRPLWAGSIGMLGAMIAVTKIVAPGSNAAFPPWQGMQYMRDQFSGRGKLQSLDNARYPDVRWTTVAEMMLRRRQDGPLAPTRPSNN